MIISSVNIYPSGGAVPTPAKECAQKKERERGDSDQRRKKEN